MSFFENLLLLFVLCYDNWFPVKIVFVPG